MPLDHMDLSTKPSNPPPAFAPAYAQATVPFYMWPCSLIMRLMLGAWEFVQPWLTILILTFFDCPIFLVNLVTPRKRLGSVIPGLFSSQLPPSLFGMPLTRLLCLYSKWLPSFYNPEFPSRWSEWQGFGPGGTLPPHDPPAPKEGLSRCCCPALNALANHGLLPRDGRRLTSRQVASACSRTYNLSPCVAYALLAPFAALWRGRGWFDSEDLNTPGLMQHDGSLTREDLNSPYAFSTVAATQGRPSQRLLKIHFPEHVPLLSLKIHARLLASRRQASREVNGHFTLSSAQAIWSSFKSALLHKCVGTSQITVSQFLGATPTGWEQLPVIWEPATRSRWGVTLIDLGLLALFIELSAGSWSTRPRMLVRQEVGKGGWNPNLGECRNMPDPA